MAKPIFSAGKRIRMFALLVMILLMAGCSGASFADDDALLQRLLGRLESPRYDMLHLYPDGTFTDTLLTEIPFSNGVYVPELVLSGTYTLRERLLEFHNIKAGYMRRAELFPDSSSEYYIYPRVVIIDKEDDILMQPIAQYTTDHTDTEGLFKQWKGEFTVVRYDGSKKMLMSRAVQEFYLLNKTHAASKYRRISADGMIPERNLTDTVIYKHPYLWLPPERGYLIRLSKASLIQFIKDPQLYLKPGD